jgi:hypothetical protein
MIDTVRGKINIKWLAKTKTQEIPNWTFQEKTMTDADGLTRTIFSGSHENGMYLSGDLESAFIVQVSLPRLHFTDNTNLITSQDELNIAFDKMRLQMLEVLEYEAIPRWTRLDLVWNFLGDIDEYIACFTNTKHPAVRNPVRVYKGESISWKGKYTELQIYDKMKEKKLNVRTSEYKQTIVRVELRKTIRTKKSDLGTKNDLTMALCDAVTNGYIPNFEKCYRYYREQVTLLSPKKIPDFSTRSNLDFIAYMQANQVTDQQGNNVVDIYLAQKSRASKYRIMRELKSRVLRHKFISFHQMLPEENTPEPIGYDDLARRAKTA